MASRRQTGWGVLLHPQRPAPLLPDGVLHVRAALPSRLEFHGGWLVDELLVPRELKRLRWPVFHATEPRRVLRPMRSHQIATVYDLIPLRERQVWRSMWLDQRIGFRWMVRNVRRAAAVVTVSEAVRRELILDVGLEPSRVHVVHPGLTPVAGRESPSSLEAGSPREGVLFVGASDPHKNVPTLLRALGSISAAQRPRLTIVGPWSDRAIKDLHETARRVGIEPPRVEAHASDDRLAQLYAEAAVLVAPSRREGFGLPALEAMSHGCPVVASDIDAHREVASGVARFVAAEDDEGFAAAIVEFVQSGDRRAEAAKLGIARAREFSWAKSLDALLACYASVGISPQPIGR